MVEVKFPGLTLPGTVKAGCLLNVTLMGAKLKIPSADIKLFKEDLTIWKPFVLFDTDWIVQDLEDLFMTPDMLWRLGDVNRDGVIDQKDGDAVTAAYMSKPGDPNWNPDADVNSDGVVDSLDRATINANYGKKAPVGNLFTQALKPHVETLKGLLGGIAPGVARALLDPGGALKGWFDDISSGKAGTLLDPGGVLKGWFGDTVRGVSDFIEDPAGAVKGWFDAIPDAVWNLARAKLDEMAAEFYERHKEET